jgi:Fe-S-cluster-containing dehydrogenase component
MANPVQIDIVAENCRGCRRCQLACSWHDPGPLNPRLAGIQILRLDNGKTDYPLINMECLERFCGKEDTPPGSQVDGIAKPACVSACLFGALQCPTEEGNPHA